MEAAQVQIHTMTGPGRRSWITEQGVIGRVRNGRVQGRQDNTQTTASTARGSPRALTPGPWPANTFGKCEREPAWFSRSIAFTTKWRAHGGGELRPLARDMLEIQMSTTRRRVILFDLGGVLVRVPGVAAMRDLAGIDSEAEVWRRWLACEWVRRYERGQCSASEFAAGVVADWDLPVTGDEFLARFREWPDGLYEGALEMVGAIREQAGVGCLSNTNCLHWEVMQRWGLAGAFDHTFLSYRMGLVKPDQAVFERVVGELGVPAGEVVFLDDNAVNVERAAALGFDAQQVQGVDQAGRALAERGFQL